MPSIYSVTTLLPFSTPEISKGINSTVQLLADSYDYSADETVAQFYANVSTPFAGDKLIINLVKDGTLITSEETVTSTTRFSFLIDISDLEENDNYSTEVYYTTNNLTGGDIFDLGASGTLTQIIDATSIASAESFGTATVKQNITVASISSAESFGTAIVNQNITVTGISSAESFGIASLKQNVTVTAIASAEEFGNASVASAGAQFIYCTGIDSSERFGRSVTYVIEPVVEETFEECVVNSAPVYCNGALIPARTYCALKSRQNFSRTCAPSQTDAPNSLKGLKI